MFLNILIFGVGLEMLWRDLLLLHTYTYTYCHLVGVPVFLMIYDTVLPSVLPNLQWHGKGSYRADSGTVSVHSSATEAAAVPPLSSKRWRIKSSRG